MNPTRSLTGTAVVVFAVAAFAADEQKPVATIPIRLNDAFQYSLQARINGSEPTWCHVDSGGGDRIYFDRDRAAKMGIQPTSTGLSAGPQDTAMKQDARTQVTLEVAGIKLTNQPVRLQSRPYDEYSCNIGQTVFRQYIVEVDYEPPAIRLYSPDHFHYAGSGKAVPFALDGGSPFVAASITTPNGKALQPRLAVDTGCGLGLVMLSKTFVDRNDVLNDISNPVPEPRYGSAGQQPRVVSARFGKFAVGPFEISDPVIDLWQVQGFGGANGPDGLLCGDFLRRFKLIFDYNGQTLILEPTGHFKDLI